MGAIDVIVFHGTFRANLKDIKKYGLGARQRKNYSFSLDNVVYLTSDADMAYDFCECAEEVSDSKYESGIVVLVLDTTTLDYSKLYNDENMRTQGNSGCYIYKGIIPPENIMVAVGRPVLRPVGKLLDLKRIPSFY